jgi:hypothetical protein
VLDRKPYFFRQSRYSGTKYEARHLNREHYPLVNVMIMQLLKNLWLNKPAESSGNFFQSGQLFEAV